MPTLILFLSFIGSFCLYQTSKKAILSNSLFVEVWLQNKPIISKITGLLLYIFSLVLTCDFFGVISGILYWILLVLLILSLLIIIAPTKKLNYKHIIFVFCILLIIQYAL